MTIKPATPLPWRLHERHSAIFGNQITATTTRDPYMISGPRMSPQDKQDAAYIVAAANAYPHLIAAIRNLLEVSGKAEWAADHSAVRTDARALLRSLGEA